MALQALLTSPQVAEIIGVRVESLYQMRRRSEGPPALRIGRRLRFRQEAVEQWLSSLEEGQVDDCDVA